jgi:hypothetical protein
MEEVETIDRRGKVKYKMQPVRDDSPVPKRTPPRNQKHPRMKSPSPVASGSHVPLQRLKQSKVRIMYTQTPLLSYLVLNAIYGKSESK